MSGEANVVRLRAPCPQSPAEETAVAPEVCSTCGGTRAIVRPRWEIIHDIEVSRTSRQAVFVADGAYRIEEVPEIVVETVITLAGGIDACPVCAAKAEAMYRGRR
jgi:hypothetical protein